MLYFPLHVRGTCIAYACIRVHTRVRMPAAIAPRGPCEFQGCWCPCFWHACGGGGEPCRRCGHGKCWHRRAAHGFASPRAAARRGTYVRYAVARVFTPVAPLVPPLPDDHGYCDTLVALPV